MLAILIHSLLGYAIARNKAHSKFYKFIYFYVVSGMFVPFRNPDDAGGKTDGADGTCEQSRSDHLISGILYADECAAVFRISDKHSDERWKRQHAWMEQVHGQLIGRSSFRS